MRPKTGVLKKCDRVDCTNEFIVYQVQLSRGRGKYCSPECAKNKIAKGEISTWKRKDGSIQTVEKVGPGKWRAPGTKVREKKPVVLQPSKRRVDVPRKVLKKPVKQLTTRIQDMSKVEVVKRDARTWVFKAKTN